MKTYSYYKSLIKLISISLLSLCILNTLSAQRFNHPEGGGGGIRPQPGGGGGARPQPGGISPQGARPPMNNFRNMNQPQRDYNNPPRGSINGGAFNPGNHNFNNRAPIIIRDNNTFRNNGNTRFRTNVNVYHREGYGFGYHPYIYHPYHPYYWGPNWHPFGYFIGALGIGAFAFTLANQNYYYNEGVYYEPFNSGYRVINAPIGAIVNSLPDGYESIDMGDQNFFYYGGSFYVEVQGGYQVIQAPYGAVVSQIPEGAVERNLNGQSVLVYNNTYFLPISQDGQDAYQVIQPN